MIGLAALVDRARAKPKRYPPPGLEWRIGAGGIGRQPRITVYSCDYKNAYQEKFGERIRSRADFDELVIAGPGRQVLLHVERLSAREWYMRIGEHLLYFGSKPNGTIWKSEWMK